MQVPTMKLGATKRLARFAVELRYSQIPSEVIARAKACVLDTLAVALYGSTKPWSRAVAGFVHSLSRPGKATVLGR
ncbi:MAG: MmgE/PrpD family protein, partial [Deltaproteobacteria bacterium]|nr:MmgE/PrpD family protein [Deltaproteobacteria bacterium]